MCVEYIRRQTFLDMNWKREMFGQRPAVPSSRQPRLSSSQGCENQREREEDMDTFFCLIGVQIRQLKTRVFRISNRAFCLIRELHVCVCVCVADPDLPQDVAESEGQLSCQLQTVHVQQVLVKQTLTMAHTHSLDQPCFVSSIYPLSFNVSLQS